jgi:hypothetical protein
VIIASVVIAGARVLSAASRYPRATESKVSSLAFANEASWQRCDEIRTKKGHLTPLRTNAIAFRRRKAREIRRRSAVSERFAFIHVTLLDNRREFLAPLQIRLRPIDDGLLIEVSPVVAVPNAIAFVSERIDPISVLVGLTRQNPMGQALRRHLRFGEGEVDLMVYEILIREREWSPEGDVRPLIFLMRDRCRRRHRPNGRHWTYGAACSRTTRTEHGAVRTTNSATLPSTIRLMPDLP